MMEEQCLEQKKLFQFKEAVAEKKRTDSRNEQLVYNRKRALMRVEIRSLRNENMTVEDHSASNQSCQETYNIQLESLKHTITNSTSQDEIWKALLQFDAFFKTEYSFMMKQQLSANHELLQSLFKIAREAALSDECKLGALQILSEVTESFKRVNDFGIEAEAIVFSVYLSIFRSAKTPRVFSTVLQGMSQLCLDNNKASEFFVKNGLYTDILTTFSNLYGHSVESDAQNAESLKDVCILIHGLSLSKIKFDYADPRLRLVFEYLMVSNDTDIHYDVSTMLFHFTKALANQPDVEWAKDQLDKMYSYGLMKVIISLIKQENVWVPVRGYNILMNITYIKSSQIKSDFGKELHESKAFDSILETLRNPNLQIVLKYHIFMTLKSLVEANCIMRERLDYLVGYISQPTQPSNSQIQKLIIETTWEAFEKMKNTIKPTISFDLIRILCETLRDETDCEFLMKCLAVLDRIMQVSQGDTKHQKLHEKWLKAYNFNGIINTLQLHQNQDISKKAVQVVSYLDSDEDSGSEFDEEDDDGSGSDSGADEQNEKENDHHRNGHLNHHVVDDQTKIVEEHPLF